MQNSAARMRKGSRNAAPIMGTIKAKLSREKEEGLEECSHNNIQRPKKGVALASTPADHVLPHLW